MRLVESSNTEVSGSSEVPRFVDKLFLGSPAAVYLLKHYVNLFQLDSKYKQKLVKMNNFWKIP